MSDDRHVRAVDCPDALARRYLVVVEPTRDAGGLFP